MKEVNRSVLNLRRGQVTIFIILAVIIVAVAALVYLLYPQIKSTFNLATDPQSYIQSCVQDELTGIINNISMQGGSLTPDHSILYYNPDIQKSYQVEYLCYTNKNLQQCVMQQPLLQSYMEYEISVGIKSTAISCFNSLRQDYQKRGYTVTLEIGNVTTSIVPQKILVTFNANLTLTKGNSQRYSRFIVPVNSNLYELTGIANNILQWEAQYGDVDVAAYMMYYHNILVQKDRQSDGTKIYSVTDLTSGDMFQFAVRSLVWPPGVGGNL